MKPLALVAVLFCGLLAAGLWCVSTDWGTAKPVVPDSPQWGEIRLEENSPAVSEANANRSEDLAGERIPFGEEPVTAKAPIQILDTEGAAVAGAEVRQLTDLQVRSAGDPWAPIRPLSSARSISNASGRVGGLQPGHYVCTRVGYAPTSFLVGAGLETKTVILHKADGTRLIVSDTTGTLVQGARLWMQTETLGWQTTMSSSALIEVVQGTQQGEILLWRTLPPGALAVVAHEGYSPRFMSIPDASSVAQLEVVLRESAVISGRIANANTVEGTYVVCAESEQYPVSSPRQLPTAPVTAEGAFDLAGLAYDVDWTLVPCVRRGTDWEPGGEGVTATAPDAGVELWLAEPISMSVRAIDPQGTPLQAAILRSLMPAVRLADAEDPTCTVASDGRTAWRSLPWPYFPATTAFPELWLSSPGYATVSLGEIPLRSGSSHDLGEVVMQPTETWEVDVIDEATAQPIGGARVRFLPDEVLVSNEYSHVLLQEAKTDASGLARLNCPHEVSGVLQATAEGWMVYRWRREGDSCERTLVAMQHPALLSITCQEVNGDPVPDSALQWHPADVSGWNTVWAGADGIAQLEVPPGNVVVRHAPGALRGRTASGGLIEMDVHHAAEGEPKYSQEVSIEALRPGEHRAVDLVVPGMSDLAVLVTLDGQPAEGCKLIGVPGTRLDIIDNNLWSVMELPKAMVPEDGVAHLYGMPTGHLMLSVVLPETDFVSYCVISTFRPIEWVMSLAIETEARTISVLGSGGEPLAGVEVGLRQVSFQDGLRVPRMMSTTPAGERRIEGTVERVAYQETDDQGKAHFDRVPADGVYVAFLRDADSLPLVAPVHLPSRERHATLQAGSGAALRLHLVWHDDGRAGAGVGFVVRGTGLRRQIVGISDEAGEILVPGLTPGEYRVGLDAGDTWRDFVLTAGEELEDTIALE